MELLLAKSSSQTLALINMIVVLFRCLFVSLTIYLAFQAIQNISAIQSYLGQNDYQTLFYIAILLVACGATYYIPALRVLHALKLLKSWRTLLWPDIILSGLAIGYLTHIWGYFFNKLKY